MVCPYCKNILPDGSQFCTKCGQAVGQVDSKLDKSNAYWSQVAEEQKLHHSQYQEILDDEKEATRRMSVKRLGITISVVLVAVVIGVFVLTGRGDSGNNINSSLQNHSNTSTSDTDRSDVNNTTRVPATLPPTEAPKETPTEEPTEAPTEATVQITEEHPFEQQYWIIFTEGTRNNRVEASTITSSLDADELFIVWNGSLTINNNSGASKCNQYYLDENGKWVKMGSYHRLSDRASNVIASNLDIYDKNGKLLVAKCFYQDLDWDLIEKYR